MTSDEVRASRVDRRELAVLLAVSSLVVGGGGALLVHHASSLPLPAVPAFSEAAGRVVALPTERCGTRSRPRTCYRPVVGYGVDGETRQATSRSGYRSEPPFRIGDSVPVLLAADGSVWLKPEWESRHAAALDVVRKDKTTYYVLGSLLLGSALFSAVLVAAVLRAKSAPAEG